MRLAVLSDVHAHIPQPPAALGALAPSGGAERHEPAP